MAQYVPSIAIGDTIVALGAFLQPYVDPSEIVRGQTNRVSPPLGSFVVLTELHISPLETPSSTHDATSATLTGKNQIDIQVDFYGPKSGDQCAMIESVFRSIYTTGQFPPGIAPLYCSDGNQSPLVTGEQQYESRWTLTASLQYNPSVALPLQSANALSYTLKEI